MRFQKFLPFFIALFVCSGGQAAQKIVGGTEAVRGEFPFIASLQSSGQHFCAGSLVRANWVLTAAHCVESTVRNFRVKLGLHSQYDTSGVETFSVLRIIRHPNYNKRTSDYDYALLQLSGNSRKKVVALNLSEISIPENEATSPMVIAAGWGAMSESSSSLPTRLRKVSVPLVSTGRCSRAYPGEITSRMICAGYSRGGRDSCQGDSGGPLIIKENNGEVRLVGVVSWGYGCARPNRFGVYSKVNSVPNWIAQNSRTRALPKLDLQDLR